MNLKANRTDGTGLVFEVCVHVVTHTVVTHDELGNIT